jgi:hypothetical protein
MEHEFRDGELGQRLRALPVPAASPGFAGRVLGAVRRAQVRARAPVAGAALAASLALGVGITTWLGHAPQAPVEQPPADPYAVMVVQGKVSPVRLMFRSPRALEGVTIHLQLPQGVELAGRPGRSELQWQTSLQAGGNLLELPVIVQGGEGGVLTASLGHGQDRRQFAVLVKVNKEA